jgi:hypothetical protein
LAPSFGPNCAKAGAHVMDRAKTKATRLRTTMKDSSFVIITASVFVQFPRETILPTFTLFLREATKAMLP